MSERENIDASSTTGSGMDVDPGPTRVLKHAWATNSDQDSPPLHFRRARPDEEGTILGVFESVFGIQREAARWQWQYHEAPAGAGTVTVAVAGDELAGCVGLMRQDLCHAGIRIPAGQGCDAMMLEAHRGRGAFVQLALANYQMAAESGCEIVVAFPNPLSFGPTLRGLKHRRIAVLTHYFRRLGTRQLAGGILDRGTRALWTIPNRVGLHALRLRTHKRRLMEVTEKLPDDLDELLADYRRSQILAFWKDAEYLRWRYEHHPQHHYRFHTLREQGVPVAFAVARVVDDVAEICELMVAGSSVRAAAELLREIVAWYGRYTDCQLVEFFGRDISLFDGAFATAGFRSSTHSQFVMTATVLRQSELAPTVYAPGDWTIVYGDTDVI